MRESKIKPENDFRTFHEWKAEGYVLFSGVKSFLKIKGKPVFNRNQVYKEARYPKGHFPSHVFHQSGDNADYDDYGHFGGPFM